MPLLVQLKMQLQLFTTRKNVLVAHVQLLVHLSQVLFLAAFQLSGSSIYLFLSLFFSILVSSFQTAAQPSDALATTLRFGPSPQEVHMNDDVSKQKVHKYMNYGGQSGAC